ncbi:Transposon Ty3-G Gag-Pol polyprotein [Labeo rohita]|uniref:Transposon Ty3-G Gag-Pol polyprotein n=1 Tax=Labeo rohita TaxID=84645 RepID=A0ABQ8L9C2_LABRO|nr:Transposon Ty3-G Gag-Pol polyprotein [Labeo rohita]
MLTINQVVSEIRSEDWFVTVDLKDTYIHVSILPQHMKFLRFAFMGKAYQYRRTTYLGVVWDSTMMQARLLPARFESILTAVTRVKEGRSLTVKQFQRLLGLMAAASNVIPFGLLYMRPRQWWLRTKGFSQRGNPFCMIKVTRQCLRALDVWKKPWFLSQGPVLGAPCRCVTLATDASLTGWGAVMSGHPARGLWSSRHLTWHISCLEMLAVFRALKHFLPDLIGHHVLVRTDNTADKLLSLRAVHVPGHLNMGADILLRQGPRPGGMDASPLGGEADLESVWPGSDVAEASSVCFSLDRSAPGSSGKSALGRGPSSFSAPFWPARAWFSDLIGVLEVMGVFPEGAHLVASGLSTEVVETILQSRAPSSRKLYALKWKLFTSWRGDHQQDPVNCPVGTVLEFLQDWFSAGFTHSTLKVYVAAIAAYHTLLGGSSVGRNPLVTGFLHGALRLRPLTRSTSLTFQRCGLFHATHFHEILCLIYATLGSFFLSSYLCSLEFPKGNVLGYVCNHGSPRERDAASRAILPASLQCLLLYLEAAGCMHRTCFKLSGLYVTPPVTSRFSIGLFAHVLQSVVTLEAFP